MVKYKNIIQVINDYCSKTHFTNAEKKELLNRLSVDEKKLLLRCATGFETFNEEEYDYGLKYGTDDELFNYERPIFDNLGQRQRKKLLENCKGFNPNDYVEDNKMNYPTLFKGDVETNQSIMQDDNGYPEGVKSSILKYWTGGQFDKIQQTFLDGNMDNVHDLGDAMGFETQSFIMKDYIENVSPHLQSNTVLWRGGHWDNDLKVGDVMTTPAFNSTSFSADCANEVGIKSQHKENAYMIKIYAPDGTKGMCINTDDLAYEYPEHEFLLGPNQKYIVLAVDDEAKTASIKLIND